jgi:hypothetical protein
VVAVGRVDDLVVALLELAVVAGNGLGDGGHGGGC